MSQDNRAQDYFRQRFLVWSNNDPNDSFEVDAPNVDAAAWAALEELGWCVSDQPIDDIPSDHDDATGNNK